MHVCKCAVDLLIKKIIHVQKYAYSSLMFESVIQCYSHSISQDEEVLQLIALTILNYKITLHLCVLTIMIAYVYHKQLLR